ncbi:hypothetical protein K504DRAFT_503308 [Pleomassaria siparia CBS 279.74]|uniref:Uncharacterized protein n=1 Tax=Pleomassaria siparia CBS 279.74 TaxID=1314801 RepID=A0A6G1K5G2_9PLEO|nr:hypothetical protein K504DRAFT_503308 [Pleomassaria siparia CBS 279.74]
MFLLAANFSLPAAPSLSTYSSSAPGNRSSHQQLYRTKFKYVLDAVSVHCGGILYSHAPNGLTGAQSATEIWVVPVSIEFKAV